MPMGPARDRLVSDLRHTLPGWFPAIGIATTAAGLEIAGEGARTLLRYDRDAIGAGEAWRLASAHFVHLGLSHLLLNLAGLALVWLLAGRRLGLAAWCFALVVVISVIDAGFWVLNPGLSWYVGLSGVLHGLLVVGAVAGLPSARGESLFLLAAVALKLLFEQFAGPLPGSAESAGGPVVVDAHLYGAVGGLIAAIPLRIRAHAQRAL